MSNELKLNEETLKEIKDIVANSMRENSFGDGMEWEMIYDGHTFVGLNNMPDVEIVENYIHLLSETDALLDKALLELNADAMLKGIPMFEFDLSDLAPICEEDKDPQIKNLKILLSTCADDAEYRLVWKALENRRVDLGIITKAQAESYDIGVQS